MLSLGHIQTEQRNAASQTIDRADSLEIVTIMNTEDQKVALAVREVLPAVARAVDVIADRLSSGGRLIYCGCGTSGRLGVLDAAECPPTFSTDPSMVRAIMAGGPAAYTTPIEGAEDNAALGERDLREIDFSAADVLVGIAASGRTPYVLGAMAYARGLGAAIIGVTCCPGSQIDTLADIGISPTPGPEVITGSTRLKSGTAQKLVLNMLTTASMVRLGKVYSNLMVDVKASNEKLVDRAVRIVRSATDASEAEALAALEAGENSAKVAIVMLLKKVDAATAKGLLEGACGSVGKALAG